MAPSTSERMTIDNNVCHQVRALVSEVAPVAKPCGNAAPMEFLLLESRDAFPAGRAAAAALRLIGRGLVEAQAHVAVLLPKPGEPFQPVS